ncbi:hypothetical protein ASPZODRAFT_151852 [Penicilliopsis zonata CBS 506.65]|uniref:FAD-binding PCMH-type domain-containing protein n=1 Tax=Penicilliopsis zonata CBS 506.65 TaxID=1073090 RepID=A0A1L9SJR7_9EURO|nr:hypothetical protein ASPZODRAFT_151852 [Penicilliopsis zonata CBS 506.65]OJJ47361.1 hypothetical protein ASPZODRAFT_151852 [Penicilliopsis zonata CBS 506.65]
MQIVRHSAPGYEEARIGRVFNARRPSRYPLAVVMARNTADVIEAVQLAIRSNCRVAIRSGGHSWAAWSVRDNSVLIDLGEFKTLQVDPAALRARASPSITGKELNGRLVHEYGLMFPGGHCPDVGLGGFLLQGGMGWNCRGWGWACERVEAVDVVTANGDLVHCNKDEHADLYWAARGAGPGFPGVVVQFHLSLIKNPVFRSSGYLYPICEYRRAFDWILSLTPGYDADTEITVVAQYPEGREELCLFILLVCMKPTAEEAEQALLPAQQSRPDGTVEEWFCKEDSLHAQYENQGKANPDGHRYCADNAYLANETADVAAVLEEAFTTLPHRKAFALWYAMDPCSRRPLPDMALSLHSDHYFALYTVWEDATDDERCTAWVQGVMQRVASHSVGAYLGDSDFQARQTQYWSEENTQRLTAIRRKWDPEARICGYLGMEYVSSTRPWRDGVGSTL